MATRSIVTSQPDVECDVCQRRLLRGEQPDVFLAAGEPRMVCELCAPRAAHQGWTRGSAQAALSAAAPSTRRGRGLLGRLLQARRLDSSGDVYDQMPLEANDLAATDADELQRWPVQDARGEHPRPVRAGAPVVEAAGATLPVEPAPTGPLQGAVDVFNASQYTRRAASLARSLGAPEVTVRPGEAVASCVVIVLAWELCWYAYEVDLDDMEGVEVRAIAQGTELSELSAHDRLANGLADERGMLALL